MVAEAARSYAAYPDTCPHCGEKLAHPDTLDENLTRQQIYRRHRRVHFDWGNVPEDEVGEYLDGGDGEDGLPDDCQFDTQTFTVHLHYEMVERVTVEAADRHQARRLAEERRNFGGEYIQTMHIETEAYGKKSQASEDYLKDRGLLPEDWDGDDDE